MNFIFLENEVKVCSKFYKKIIFVNRGLYAMVCKIDGPVEFYSDYRIYLVLHFILYIEIGYIV